MPSRDYAPIVVTPRRPLGDLQRRRFSNDDVLESLAQNRARYDKVEREDEYSEPVEREDAPDSGEWERIFRAAQLARGGSEQSPDMSGYEGMPLTLKEKEPNAFWKGINALTDPLSGGYFGKKMREINDQAPIKEDYFQATGQGDMQDWLAWMEASVKGAKQGATEGVADLADQMTSPADLAALTLTGGAFTGARAGYKGIANAMRQGARVAGAPIAARGMGRIYDTGIPENLEDVKELGIGAFQTLMGGAQSYFPESALPSPKPRVKPKVKLTAGVEPTNITGEIDLSEGLGPQPDFAGDTAIGRDFGRGRLNQEEIRPIRSMQDRPITDDLRPDPIMEARTPKSSEADVNTINQAVEQQMAPPPIEEDFAPFVDEEPVPEPQSEIERMMVGREPTGRLDLGVQEAPISNWAKKQAQVQEAASVPPEEFAIPDAPPMDATAASARLDELGGKSTLTAEEALEWDQLIDAAHPQSAEAPESAMGFVKNLAKSEKGELDIGELFNRYQRRKRMQSKPPVQQRAEENFENWQNMSGEETAALYSPEARARRMAALEPADVVPIRPEEPELVPGSIDDLSEAELGIGRNIPDPDAVNLGELPEAGIDLNEAAITAGSDLAKRVRPSAEARPSRMQRLLEDETGAIGDQDRDPFGNLTQSARDKIINRKFGLTEGPVGESARTGMRRVISAIKKSIGGEDYAALPDDEWRSKFGKIRSEQVAFEIDDALNYLKTQGQIENIPGQAAESTRMIEMLENLKGQALQEKSTSFLERLRETLNDETGAIGPGQKKPKPTPIGVEGETFPEFINRVTGKVVTPERFTQWDPEVKLAARQQYDASQRGLKATAQAKQNVAARQPEPAGDVVLKKTAREAQAAEPVVDVSKLKLRSEKTPQEVVDPETGEITVARNTAIEDAKIMRLQEEVGKAADRERNIAMQQGEKEMDPVDLNLLREKMRSGDRVVTSETPESRRQKMPLLRSKDYIQKLTEFMKNEKGELNLEALLRGEETPAGVDEFAMDLPLQKQKIGGTGPYGYSPKFEPRKGGFQPKEILPGESIGDYIKRNGVESIDTTADEALANQAAMNASEPGLMERFKNFMQDESGEINFGGGYGEEIPRPPQRPTKDRPIPAEQGPTIRLLSEEQLDPSKPVKELPDKEANPPTLAREVWNTGQSLMSVDLPYITSAAFRQASPLAWTKDWFDAWGQAAKAFGDKEAADAIMDSIMNSKNFKKRFKPVVDQDGNLKSYKEVPSIADEIGVRLSDPRTLNNREETMRSTLAERVPGYGRYVKASNRAYSTFLNHLRQTRTDQMLAGRKWSGLADDKIVGKQIGDYVNDMTGRSSLKLKTPLGEVSAEKNAEALALALWSPRLIARNVRMLNPMTYMGLDKQVRTEYLKGLVRSLGTWAAFATLAKMGGAQVSMDPTNADFGKIRLGDTRIDTGAGMQQLLVFGSRMASGKFTSSNTGETTEMGEGFKPRTRKSTAEEFLASKLHPSAKLAYDLLSASQSSPVHLGDRAVQMAVPMLAQDLWEVMKANPELAVAIGPLSSVGMGTSNYGKTDEFGKPVFSDDIFEGLGLDEYKRSLTVGGKAPKRY